MARERDNPQDFCRQVSVVIQALAIAGGSGAVCIALAGKPLFLLTFGPDYADALPLILPIGVLAVLHFARIGPNVIALSRGQTNLILAGGIVRVLALPIAVGIVLAGGSMLDIVVVGIAGETAAVAVTLALLSRTLDLAAPVRRCLGALGLGVALLVVLLLWDLLALSPGTSTATAAVLLLAMGFVSHDLRRWVIKGFARRLRG
jgi:O-antigen/teichoic acid export membrane protein